jgi:hypothetical protein
LKVACEEWADSELLAYCTVLPMYTCTAAATAAAAGRLQLNIIQFSRLFCEI